MKLNKMEEINHLIGYMDSIFLILINFCKIYINKRSKILHSGNGKCKIRKMEPKKDDYWSDLVLFCRDFSSSTYGVDQHNKNIGKSTYFHQKATIEKHQKYNLIVTKFTEKKRNENKIKLGHLNYCKFVHADARLLGPKRSHNDTKANLLLRLYLARHN